MNSRKSYLAQAAVAFAAWMFLGLLLVPRYLELGELLRSGEMEGIPSSTLIGVLVFVGVEIVLFAVGLQRAFRYTRSSDDGGT
jgi:ABC-type dipeptide/oligopeptide/nickel transport system permease subunit